MPVALYLLGVWVLDAKGQRGRWSGQWSLPGTSALVLVAAGVGLPVLAIGMLLAACVTLSLAGTRS